MKVKSALDLDQDEEEIREQVRRLSDAQRKTFHDRFSREYKDPDTYAALNFLFVAGLHHFYLGRRLRGSINLAVFGVGLLLLFTPLQPLGWAMIIGISVIELHALFFAQRIVQSHNNRRMQTLLQQIDA